MDIIIFSGDTAHLKASFKDVPPDTHTFEWDFGDGTTASGPVTTTPFVNADHSYLVPGTYTVKLKITDDNGGIGMDTVKVVVKRKLVNIDIKPGSWPNSLNLNGNGVVPVGVLGSPELNVSDINFSTVKFGVTGLEAVPVHEGYCGHIEDLNSDGIKDAVFHFREGELGISTATPANTEMPLRLTAQLNSGIYIEGKDIVRVTLNNENSQGKGGKGPK